MIWRICLAVYLAIAWALGTSMLYTTYHLEPTSLLDVLWFYGMALLWPLWAVAIFAGYLWRLIA